MRIKNQEPAAESARIQNNSRNKHMDRRRKINVEKVKPFQIISI
jgi:hypothetical protein